MTSVGIAIVVVMVSVLLLLYSGPPAKPSQRKVYAFFHPHVSGGGGGERVLWKLIQFLQRQQQQQGGGGGKGQSEEDDGTTPSKIKIVIFSIDPPTVDESQIRMDAQRRFDVHVPDSINLISLEDCKSYLNPKPFLSLVMESWGTMQLAYQGISRYQQQFPNEPIDVYWDTTGCAFTFLVARWLIPSAWIFAYVHYPTISTDMMAWEWKKQRQTGLARKVKTTIKLIYYWFFVFLYGLVGSLADMVLVNSTWTYGHIKTLWGFFSARRIHIVYPPCLVPDVPDSIQTSSSPTSITRTRRIVSIGQFRPEKDHALQVESLARLFEKYPIHKDEKVQLIMIGSCRNEADQQRVSELRTLIEQRNLTDFVEFMINPSNKELQEFMASSLVGIHTMRQEHFGIGIVEMMALGLLTVAHDSGGPKTDIVQHKVTGYLATSPEEYAEVLHEALTLPDQEAETMRIKARSSVTRFSDRAFDDALPTVLSKLA